ncbi:MAG: type II toxin-antitoxin system RelE/ParE family toxin [Acidobacteriota bacterium]
MGIVNKHEQAIRDLEEIFVFIGEQDVDAAISFLLAAEQTFKLLAKMPLMGSSRRFRSSRLRNLRQFPVKNHQEYLIFYHPAKDGVQVVRVLHGKRDLEAIFAKDN